MARQVVVATRDFTYDKEVGTVKLGQVFTLKGQPNDHLLIEHGFVRVVEKSPETTFKCGTCGRAFESEWHRDRCGRSHDVTTQDAAAAKRQKAHERVMAVSQ